jgi:hypothetical protein
MIGGLIRLTQPVENPCQVMVGFRIIRLQFKASVITVDGLGKFADIGQGITCVQEIPGVGLSGSNESIEGLQGGKILMSVKLDKGQLSKNIRIVRVGLKSNLKGAAGFVPMPFIDPFES